MITTSYRSFVYSHPSSIALRKSLGGSANTSQASNSIDRASPPRAPRYTCRLQSRPRHREPRRPPAFNLYNHNHNNNHNSKPATHPHPPPPSMSSEPTPTPPKITTLTSSALLSLLANRRSYYNLSSTSPIPDHQLKSILTQILLTVPSAFNTQSTRLILLLNTHHHKLWDITTHLVRTHMGESRWSSNPSTANNLSGFRSAYGTVLFYEDTNDVEPMKTKFKNYADKFDGWSEHTSGMHQLAVWTALEAEGFGANLQHYNSIIDEDVAKEFGVPGSWTLRAQLVFGAVGGDKERPEGKEKKDTKETLRVFGMEE